MEQEENLLNIVSELARHVANLSDPDICYKGSWIEIGIALGLDKKVIIIGEGVTSVFLSLPNVVIVRYKEEALEIISNFDGI